MATGDIVRIGGSSALLPYFGWAGEKYPFAGTEDLVISSDTTWNDILGYKKVRKLTINAGVTLNINKTPFYIFAEEIEFKSTTSRISIDGASGSELGYIGNQDESFAKGGSIEEAYGGYGGGMLFVICNKIFGSKGQISANGGNAYTKPEIVYEQYSSGAAGHGAMGYKGRNSGNNISLSTQGYGNYSPYLRLLANGAFATTDDGGSGIGGADGRRYANGGYYYYAGGGSGIGGGGGIYNSSNMATTYVSSPGSPSKALSPQQLLYLAYNGCAGGGGGAVHKISKYARSGGGGGGSVCLFYKDDSSVLPALTANGGLGSTHEVSSDSSISGGAGITHIIKI